MNYERLKNTMIKYEPKSIFLNDGNYVATTEWLVGTFCGVGFQSQELEDSLSKMCDYFDRHKGHDSMVGTIVTQSGWPDLDKVEQYINV